MAAFLTFLLAYVLSQFYRSFLAVIAPELARQLALDPQALGNLQAWWIAGFVAMQIPVGWALDTVGPRRTIAVNMLFAVAGGVMFARAGGAAQLDAAMVLIGMGCSAIYMGAIYTFGRTAAPARFALLCSWLLGLGSAGNLLAAAPLAWAATGIGWRAAMLAIAILTALSAASVFLCVRDPARLERRGATSFRAGLLEILKIRALWPLLPLTLVGYSVVLSERGLWAGPFFSDVHGLAPVARGNALLVMAAAMSAGAMIYGPLDRLLRTRKWIVALGSAVTALGFLALGLLDLPLGPATLVMALIGGFGMTYGVLMAHARGLFPDRVLGRGITLLNILFLGGAGLMQPLSGWLMQRAAGLPPAQSYATLHLLFAGLLIAGLAVYLFSEDRPPQRPTN